MPLTWNPKTVFSFTLAAVVVIATVATSALAQDNKFGDLIIEEPWTRATPPSASTGGGYMTITNTGSAADVLVSGIADFAGKVEFHEMSMQGDVMKMRPLTDGLELPPGATVELKPGGYHIMFMQLWEQLVEGEMRSVTTTFKNAGEVTLMMPVKAMGTTMKHGGTTMDGETREGTDHAEHSSTN